MSAVVPPAPMHDPGRWSTRAARSSDERLSHALGSAWAYVRSIQQPRGCWQGEVEWNTMIASQVVFVRHILGQPPSQRDRLGLLKYFASTQRGDGSWGMHPSSEGYVFTTALTYVAARLLGIPAEDPRCQRALAWLRERGGVAAIPTWGKLWLALVGLYRWEGVNPVLPEMWLSPEANPLHPSRYYCHTRLIYLPMSYLWAARWQAPPTPTLIDVRRELWGSAEAFAEAEFSALRHALAPSDVYVPPGRGLQLAYDALRVLDRFIPSDLRARATRRVIEHIEYELETTRHACISPVNGLLNIVALHVANPHHAAIAPALAALEVWRWEDAERGVRYAGANSHSWDTAFVVQGVLAGPIAAQAGPELRQAHAFFSATQVRAPLPDGDVHYRAPREGGWCFSDDTHLWPVSDTTAEALASVLELQARGVSDHPLDSHRLEAAARFILARQNPDGGWGSYERRRGSLLLERINPSEMYGNCMTERSYTECTASCVKALAALRRHAPTILPRDVRRAIERGVALLRARQGSDGAWSAVWAVNYTYGTFFAVEALLAAGVSPRDPAVERACSWVRSVQKADGSWGEDWRSCLEHRYIEHAEGQVSMTAWALLTLLLAGDAEGTAVERGVAFLLSRQRPDGSWPRQDVAGVFFHTAMLEYALYKDIFPTWALNLYASRVGIAAASDAAGRSGSGRSGSGRSGSGRSSSGPAGRGRRGGQRAQESRT